MAYGSRSFTVYAGFLVKNETVQQLKQIGEKHGLTVTIDEKAMFLSYELTVNVSGDQQKVDLYVDAVKKFL